MNVQEFIKYAKRVLNEDAGSEGMAYKISAKSGLKAYSDDKMTINEVKTVNDGTEASVQFTYPHDYGFALQSIKDALGDIQITSLTLLY